MFLITGAKGQLGQEVIRQFDGKYKYIGIDIDQLDITDNKKTIELINEIKPTHIIHCAAYTNVDKCEDEIDLAFKVNAIGTRNLAITAEKVNAKLIYISTDYVFDGEKQTPYNEFDVPHPQSIYGKSKLAGENFVKEFCNRYFILRIAWLYGIEGNNFVKTIIRLAKEKGKLEVVDDQKGNPTFTRDVAKIIELLMETEKYGIYHVTNEGTTSWYGFTQKILKEFNIDCDLQPTTSDKFVRPAKRPKNSSLDKMMLRLELSLKMRYWEEAFEEFASEMKGRL
ncbi:dTDP-4-dehydrorhamnose reductase [Caldicellulosiruptoraceae bacterium PP1]